MSRATDLRRQTSCERAEQACAQLRQVVGFSVADAIEKLERLKNSGPFQPKMHAYTVTRF